MAEIYCNNCGHLNPPGSNFCSSCGGPLEHESPEDHTTMSFQIEPSEFAQAAIGRRVEVVDFPDGRLEVRYKGRSMPYRTFARLRRVTETAVLENKRLGGLLTLIRQSQQSESPGMRTSKGPKRRDQTKHMFSVG